MTTLSKRAKIKYPPDYNPIIEYIENNPKHSKGKARGCEEERMKNIESRLVRVIA